MPPVDLMTVGRVRVAKANTSSMIRRAMTLLALLAFIAGCSYAPSLNGSIRDTEKLEALFPLVERLTASSYWVNDDCRYIAYQRGSFSTDPSVESACQVWDRPDPRVFDDRARADIAVVEKEIANAGLSVDYFSVTFKSDGSVGPESFFSIGPCDNLVYRPSWTSLPSSDTPEEEVVGAVTADWYEIASSC
jgi:hypothetical protein